ncbi:unnamed protein product, partial [Pylaiella littoralis]
EDGYGGSLEEAFYEPREEGGGEGGENNRGEGMEEGPRRGGRSSRHAYEGEDEEEEEDDSLETGSEGIGVSGLPISEVERSSGDERIWRAAARFR